MALCSLASVSVTTESAQEDRAAEPVTKNQVIVLFGATGDLAKRKLLPGLLRLTQAGLLPEARIVGTSLEELTKDQFVELARAACAEFGKGQLDDGKWDRFAAMLSYVPTSLGSHALAEAVHRIGRASV